MSDIEKFKIVRQMIVGRKVKVTGGPCRDEVVTCLDMIKWPNEDQYDILTGKSSIGVGIDEIHTGGFSGKTATLSGFIRKVDLI
jgi:hypothetical protein